MIHSYQEKTSSTESTSFPHGKKMGNLITNMSKGQATDFQELGKKKYKSGLHNLDMLAEVAVKERESRKKEKVEDDQSRCMWRWHSHSPLVRKISFRAISCQKSSLIISEKCSYECPIIISDDQTCPNLHDNGTKLDDEGIFLEKGKDVLETLRKDQYSRCMWQWHTRNHHIVRKISFCEISYPRSSRIISKKGCHCCPMINTQRALYISDDQTCPNLHDNGKKLVDDEGIFLDNHKVNNLSGKKRRLIAINSPASVKQLIIREPNKAKLDVNLGQSESKEMPESSRRIRERQWTSSVSQSQSETSVEMPETIRRIRERPGVSSVTKLIEKQLFKTDVAANNGRLSIPLSQVSTEFLTQDEKERLDTKVGTKWAALEVDLIEPSDSVKNIEIRKWCFRGASSIYVLTKRWMEVVKNNALQAGDRIQVWWFREANDLKLVLIILSRAGHIQNP